MRLSLAAVLPIARQSLMRYSRLVLLLYRALYILLALYTHRERRIKVHRRGVLGVEDLLSEACGVSDELSQAVTWVVSLDEGR